ncbi:LexA family protein [Streptomyces sp. NPDC048567]|uniref:LexA family protein n=1 Tax=Streptomyces sp. NPDC048567 TaxID=3365570 RepID=UPI00371C266F
MECCLPGASRTSPPPCHRAAPTAAAAVDPPAHPPVLVDHPRRGVGGPGGATPPRPIGCATTRGAIGVKPAGLSARQEAVLRAVREWIAEHGEGPSLRQVGARVGLSSTSSVAYQLGRLEARGFISRTGRRWQTCRLL